MYKKNIFQNGEKSIDSVVSIFSPTNRDGKDQDKVEVQQGNSEEIILNQDFQLPNLFLNDRNVLMIRENQKAKDLYAKTLADYQMIDYEKRKPQTYDGVHVDFGVPILDVVDMAITLMERLGPDGQPLVSDDGKLFEAILALAPDLKVYKETGEISEKLSQYGNEIKDFFLPELLSAKNKYYYSDPENSGSTVLMEKMTDMLNGLGSFAEVIQKNPQESVDYMSDRLAKVSNSLYDYVKGEDIYSSSKSSKNAKTRLISNPWYLGYIETIKEALQNYIKSLVLQLKPLISQRLKKRL